MRQYADFSGRARRKEYWMFTLFWFLILWVIGILANIISAVFGIGNVFLLLFAMAVYILATIIPMLAVTVRRLHDVGLSGLWALLTFVPIGDLVLLVIMMSNGQPNANKWGANPKMDMQSSSVSETARTPISYANSNMDSQRTDRKFTGSIQCPYCGEAILAEAKKCKNCGEWLEKRNKTPKMNEPDIQQSTVATKQNEPDIQQSTVETKLNLTDTHKFLLGIAIGVICACLIGGLFFIFKQDKGLLYLKGMMQCNSDCSYFVGLATDNFDDFFPALEEECEDGCIGGGQIVIRKVESKTNKLKSILKSTQFDGPITKAYPSSKYPTVVYFGGEKYNEGDRSFFYGKIDIETKKFDVFEGQLLGIVERGRYKDCFFVHNGNLLYLFRQSPISETNAQVVTYNQRQFSGDSDLSDDYVQKTVINWLENQ